MPPSWRAETEAMKKEIRRLWAALSAPQRPEPSQEVMPFSWAREVDATRTSGPWYVPAPSTLCYCTIGYRIADSGGTTVDILVGGVSQWSGTIGAGQTRFSEQFSISVPAHNRVQILVSPSSGDGEDMTVLIGYVRSYG